MLWIIKETSIYIKYSPMIVHIGFFLLLFLTEAEAYFCLRAMLELSKNSLDETMHSSQISIKRMGWYVTLEQADFLKMCSAFFELVEEKSSYFMEVLNHFKKLKFDYMKLFEEWIGNLFTSYFPLHVKIKNKLVKLINITSC